MPTDEHSDEPLVTISFRTRGGDAAHVNLPWRSGKKLKDYLHDPSLQGHAVVAVALRSRIMDQRREKLRLTSVLKPDTVVLLVPTERVNGG